MKKKKLPIPITRSDEYFKNGIIDSNIDNLPAPVNRSDEYLHYIATHPPDGTITPEQKLNIEKIYDISS